MRETFTNGRGFGVHRNEPFGEKGSKHLHDRAHLPSPYEIGGCQLQEPVSRVRLSLKRALWAHLCTWLPSYLGKIPR